MIWDYVRIVKKCGKILRVIKKIIIILWARCCWNEAREEGFACIIMCFIVGRVRISGNAGQPDNRLSE
jgi:hypothetical protein